MRVGVFPCLISSTVARIIRCVVHLYRDTNFCLLLLYHNLHRV